MVFAAFSTFLAVFTAVFFASVSTFFATFLMSVSTSLATFSAFLAVVLAFFFNGFGGFFHFRFGLFYAFLEFQTVGFGDFYQGGFATGGGIFLQETFFHGFVIFGLGLGEVRHGRVCLEGFEGGFDGFFDLLVVLGSLFSLASSFFRRFDNRHLVYSLRLILVTLDDYT